MAEILGLEFSLGREIPKPAPIELGLPASDVLDARIDWAGKIVQAAVADGAWGVLRIRPDGSVNLFDARPESIYAATDWGGTVHLLLGRPAA